MAAYPGQQLGLGWDAQRLGLAGDLQLPVRGEDARASPVRHGQVEEVVHVTEVRRVTGGLQVEADPVLGWGSGELGQPLRVPADIPGMHNHSVGLRGPAVVDGEATARDAVELRAVEEGEALPEGPRPQPICAD